MTTSTDDKSRELISGLYDALAARDPYCWDTGLDVIRQQARAFLREAPLPPIEEKGTCPHCNHENGGHYSDCSTVENRAATTAPQGETPRTDAVAEITSEPPFIGRAAGQLRWIEFARQLQRELAAERAKVLQAEHDAARDRHIAADEVSARVELQRELAEAADEMIVEKSRATDLALDLEKALAARSAIRPTQAEIDVAEACLRRHSQSSFTPEELILAGAVLRWSTAAPAEWDTPQWIPVSERLPTSLTNVAILISDKDSAIENWVTAGYLHSCKNWWSGRPGKYDSLVGWEVTHWMPLPPGPEQR